MLVLIRNLTYLQYDACNNQPADALDSFKRCLELNPHLPEVHARCRVLQSQILAPKSQVSNEHRISTMCDSKLRLSYDSVLEAEGNNIVINPIRRTVVLEEDDYSDEDSDEYGDDEYGDDGYSDDEGDDSRT